jgi:ferredoxin-nitrite reductase
MLRIADIAERYGRGEIRLTVWQNFIIPNVASEDLTAVHHQLESIGLGTSQSNLASGVIACTGNSYCKFAQSNTKAHALDLIRYLEPRIRLDKAINIHFTGCPNSCAQHYMGDIGCLGTKTKIAGESFDAYHVFVGGGFGKNQAVGRQVFSAVPASELPHTVERVLLAFLHHRRDRETFQQFSMRHDLETLQTIFAGVKDEAHVAGQH